MNRVRHSTLHADSEYWWKYLRGWSLMQWPCGSGRFVVCTHKHQQYHTPTQECSEGKHRNTRPGSMLRKNIFCEWGILTRFNKIAIQGTHQMAVDKEAISLSIVYSYDSLLLLLLLLLQYDTPSLLNIWCRPKCTCPYSMCNLP